MKSLIVLLAIVALSVPLLNPPVVQPQEQEVAACGGRALKWAVRPLRAFKFIGAGRRARRAHRSCG